MPRVYLVGLVDSKYLCTKHGYFKGFASYLNAKKIPAYLQKTVRNKLLCIKFTNDLLQDRPFSMFFGAVRTFHNGNGVLSTLNW